MKVLFICAENTCRSQMAEGFARAFGIDAASAGMQAGSGVNPDAILVMNEAGIDISAQTSKDLKSIDLSRFDTVISLCSTRSEEVCPTSFTGRAEHWDIDDPKGLALDEYRRVRDLIDARVQNLHFQN